MEDLLAVLELEEHAIAVLPLHQTYHNQLFWPLPGLSEDERVVHGDLPVLQHVRLLDYSDLPGAIAFLGRIQSLRLRNLGAELASLRFLIRWHQKDLLRLEADVINGDIPAVMVDFYN